MAAKWDMRKPVAILQGGSRHGWVYYETDIEQEARATERMGRAMVYERTERFEPHPTVDVACRVWQYNPTRKAHA